MDLFGQDLLDAATHKAVLGELPASLQQSLRTTEVADLVLRLLDAGWRPGQLAARIGALPAGPDPAADVTALLRGFLEQVPPDARWREERAAREREEAWRRAAEEEPATDESRERWVAEIRANLGRPRTPRTARTERRRPDCSLCGEESSYFVTREVRLCDTCVGLLSAGGVRLTMEDGLDHTAGLAG